jgi:hypothetical protein
MKRGKTENAAEIKPLRSRLLAVRLQPCIDQRHLRIDRRMAQPLLLGDELHQLVRALDVGRTVLQRARLRPGA